MDRHGARVVTHRDMSHHRIGGRVEDRNVIIELIRYVCERCGGDGERARQERKDDSCYSDFHASSRSHFGVPLDSRGRSARPAKSTRKSFFVELGVVSKVRLIASHTGVGAGSLTLPCQGTGCPTSGLILGRG